MNKLRKVTNWISHHRFWSVLFTAVIISLCAFGKVVLDRSEGTLSSPLAKGTIVDAVYGIGTVTATRSYAVKPGVISSINDLYVKEGDFIRKGKRLARIDDVLYSAPFDGTVNFLPFKVGENIFTQLPVMVLTDLQNRYLVVSLEQQGALRVKAGQKAKLSFDSIRGQSFDGEVKSVYSYNNNFLARIDVLSLPPEILPDMTADIAIVIREVSNVLLLPTSALDGSTVWVQRPHWFPEQISVTLGVVDGAMVEVATGDLREGERVLIRKKIGI